MTDADANASVQIYRGMAGLEQLRVSWQTLARRVPDKRFFHLYEWHRCYLDALEKDQDAAYFLAYLNGGELEAVCPLFLRTRKYCGLRVSCLETATHSHISLNDILCVKKDGAPDYVRAFVQFLSSQTEIRWDIVDFSRVLQDSRVYLSLHTGWHAASIIRAVDQCDYLPLGDYDSFLEKISDNFRNSLRKARNKLNSYPEVKFIASREAPDLQSSFLKFLELEASGWKGASGTNSAINQNAQLRQFYECLLQDGFCEVGLLLVSDVPIAGTFSIHLGDTYYILKIAYNEAYSRAAPGNMLLERLMQHYSASEDVRTINLVSGAEWHRRWKPQQLEVFDCRLFNRSLNGLLVFACFKSKLLIRPVYQSLRRLLMRDSTADSATGNA